MRELRVAVAILIGLALAVFAVTVPGLMRLPRPGRTTVDGVTTLDDAVVAARASGLLDWDLVAFVQLLAARKFAYSRRNPWGHGLHGHLSAAWAIANSKRWP
jgi:hypothetical protein